MSLRLVIEHSPHRQPVAELAHSGGELSIGRGVEADWPLEDPEMFISRKHCIISGGEDGFTVTDVSRGGLFVDGADAPLGAGRSCELRDGMRLRLGDVVIRVELRPAMVERAPAGAMPRAENSFAADEFFARRPVAEPLPPPRPSSLPDPFDARRERVRGATGTSGAKAAAPPFFDDPFTLDPLPSARAEAERPVATPSRPPEPDPFGDGGRLFSGPEPGGMASVSRPARADPGPSADSVPARPGAADGSGTAPARAASPDLAQAFLKGMGLDPARTGEIGPAEMELLGRRFRALVEALEHSLRSRSREKRNLRVAQTVIGSADVNPLKFLPSTEEMLEAMIGPPRPGYMDADAAIAAAQRDLADHQLRSWSGLQAALRRMIERFDPEEIERELEAAGKLRAILAGGRSALLWRLYCERYKTIAMAAQSRFLGEVGSDFREAYEGRTEHDG